MMTQNQTCKKLAEIGELSLNAKSDEEAMKITKMREEHYMTCSHPQCQENMAFLKKEGLWQISEERQREILGNLDEDGEEIEE